jgi:DNA mismatch endonuclease (patch repair protein)
MSSIRGKDTKPEILVRKGLHARGFRFRLQDRRLPGRPDLVLPRYGVAVMVNGCFWHGHQGCRYATRPKSNIEFWAEKISRNRHRDQVTEAHLEALGWKVITVWECELRGAGAAEARLEALAQEIRRAGAEREQARSRRREDRMARRLERECMLERQTRLEAELHDRYHVPRSVKEQSKEAES